MLTGFAPAVAAAPSGGRVDARPGPLYPPNRQLMAALMRRPLGSWVKPS